MKFIKYITYIILIMVIGLPLKAQHWEIIPACKYYKQLDTVYMDKDYYPDLYIYDVRGDTLISSSGGYFHLYHDKKWKFIHTNTILERNIQDTSILNQWRNTQTQSLITNISGEDIVFELAFSTRIIDQLHKIITLYRRNGNSYTYKTIDKIYNSDLAKYDTIAILLNVSVNKDNSPYFLLITFRDWFHKPYYSRVRLCTIEADTFRTLKVFYDKNLSKGETYFLKLDKSDNLVINIQDSIYYFENNKIIKSFNLNNIIDKNGIKHSLDCKELIFDNNNNLILLNKSNLIAIRNDDKWSVDTIPESVFSNIIIDNENNLWVESSDYMYKRNESGIWSKVFIEPDYSTSRTRLYCDKQNRIWVSRSFPGVDYRPINTRKNAAAGIYYIND